MNVIFPKENSVLEFTPHTGLPALSATLVDNCPPPSPWSHCLCWDSPLSPPRAGTSAGPPQPFILNPTPQKPAFLATRVLFLVLLFHNSLLPVSHPQWEVLFILWPMNESRLWTPKLSLTNKCNPHFSWPLCSRERQEGSRQQNNPGDCPECCPSIQRIPGNRSLGPFFASTAVPWGPEPGL